MSSKKKSRSKRKRSIRASRPTREITAQTEVVATQAAPVQVTAPTKTKLKPSSASTAVVPNEWDYVHRDVRRIIALSIGCIGIELVLWWLLSATSLGPQVYRLIQL